MARVFAAKLTDMWGQQVLVENKPGAAGAIGTEYAARQPADGYSFMIANLGPIAVNPLLSSVPYNVEKDFAPVSQISQGPNVLVVRADAPFKSLKDIIDFGIANPGKLSSARRSGRVSARCRLFTSACCASVSARIPPHEPVPMTATPICLTGSP